MVAAVVIGAGPGIGRSVAVRLARAGLAVAVMARTEESVEKTAGAVSAAGGTALPLVADATDEVALRAALDTAEVALGPADLVVYNAALIRPDAIGDLPARAHLDAWAVNVVGAITAAARVLPGMAARGGGTFIVTGGMPEPKPGYVSLSLGKAGVRSLVDLLDRQYASAGVHVATVTVTGTVAPGTAFDPDEIAEHYWHLHNQRPGAWEREVTH